MRRVVDVPSDTITSKGRSGSARIVDGLSPVNGVIVHSLKLLAPDITRIGEAKHTRIEAKALFEPARHFPEVLSMLHFYRPKPLL